MAREAIISVEDRLKALWVLAADGLSNGFDMLTQAPGGALRGKPGTPFSILVYEKVVAAE
jgi:hypothetical protein